MLPETIEVREMYDLEARSHQRAPMFPVVAIYHDNPIAPEMLSHWIAERLKTELGSEGREHRLRNLGIDSAECGGTEDVRSESLPLCIEHLLVEVEKAF